MLYVQIEDHSHVMCQVREDEMIRPIKCVNMRLTLLTLLFNVDMALLFRKMKELSSRNVQFTGWIVSYLVFSCLIILPPKFVSLTFLTCNICIQLFDFPLCTKGILAILQIFDTSFYWTVLMAVRKVPSFTFISCHLQLHLLPF